MFEQPFKPDDPMDAMSEMFRRQITDVALQAYKVAIYRDLNPQEQLEAFMAGALTGVIGVALASVRTDGADAMMEYIVSCLPIARQMAESICDQTGSILRNHHDGVVSGAGEHQ